MVYTEYLQLNTKGDTDMHNLTQRIARIVQDSGLERGTATIFTPSSTSALTTIEFESGALHDLARALDEIAPADREYKHNLRWHDGNGHSHLRAALMGPSLNIPFVGGELALGTWQQVLFLDFDVRPRERRLVVQVVGE